MNKMKGHVMRDPSECDPETLLLSLVYLQQEASQMALHFEAHLIGVAVLAIRDALESRRNPSGRKSLIVSSTVSKSLH